MDPISLAALILTQTGLGGWVKDKLGGVVTAPVADKIVAVAKAVTGVTDPAEIPTLSPAQAEEVRQKLVDNEQEIVRLQFADVADARNTYRSTDHIMADKISDIVVKYNLVGVVALMAVNGLVLWFVKEPTITLAVGNIIGGSINNLWQERQTVFGFYLGSSIGSKLKDRT